MSIIRKIIRIMFTEHFYVVAYRKKERELGVFMGDDSPFHIISPTFCYWHADPIVYCDQNKTYILTEMYNRLIGVGRIGEIEIVNGRDRKAKKILSEPFHLSFPCVFKLKDKTYLMPESSEANQIRIYVKSGKDNQWIVEKIIKGIEVVDTVILNDEKGSYVYLLSGIENPKDYQKNRNKLSIFKLPISSILSDKIDISEDICDITNRVKPNQEWSYIIRNGGPIVTINKKIYRIVQMSTEKEYGKEVCLFEINICDDSNYEEIQRGRVSAQMLKFEEVPRNWAIQRIHTYSCTSDYEVVDLYVERKSCTVLLGKMIRYLIIYIFKLVKRERLW